MRGPVSIIVPIFNEKENVRPLHEAIHQALEGMEFELLLVNDGSTDGSTELLDTIAEEDPRVRVIHFVRNYGQTAALTAGFRNARHEHIVTLDGDLQNDPKDIPTLLDHLGDDCDVVCGWRKDRKDPYLTRKLPSKMANGLISRLSNVRVHDYGCTLRAYKAEFVREVPLYGEMHRFLPIYVTWAGARLKEIPVTHHPRTKGESKYGLGRIPKVLLDLTTLKFLRDYYVTPIYFFGLVGLMLVLAGLISGALAICAWSWWEMPILASCLTVVAPMLVLFGVVQVTLGVMTEVMIRMHYDIRDKEPFRIRTTRNMEN
jgi:glycosyltransferase involved in cell wall biosynthesis